MFLAAVVSRCVLVLVVLIDFSSFLKEVRDSVLSVTLLNALSWLLHSSFCFELGDLFLPCIITTLLKSRANSQRECSFASCHAFFLEKTWHHASHDVVQLSSRCDTGSRSCCLKSVIDVLHVVQGQSLLTERGSVALVCGGPVIWIAGMR